MPHPTPNPGGEKLSGSSYSIFGWASEYRMDFRYTQPKSTTFVEKLASVVLAKLEIGRAIISDFVKKALRGGVALFARWRGRRRRSDGVCWFLLHLHVQSLSVLYTLLFAAQKCDDLGRSHQALKRPSNKMSGRNFLMGKVNRECTDIIAIILLKWRLRGSDIIMTNGYMIGCCDLRKNKEIVHCDRKYIPMLHLEPFSILKLSWTMYREIIPMWLYDSETYSTMGTFTDDSIPYSAQRMKIRWRLFLTIFFSLRTSSSRLGLNELGTPLPPLNPSPAPPGFFGNSFLLNPTCNQIEFNTRRYV